MHSLFIILLALEFLAIVFLIVFLVNKSPSPPKPGYFCTGGKCTFAGDCNAGDGKCFSDDPTCGGQNCQYPPSPLPLLDDPWIGWATTTNFTDSNPYWPNNYGKKSIKQDTIAQSGTIKIGEKVVNVVRYPFAIPWGIIAQHYGNRDDWIYDIIDSASKGTFSRSKDGIPPCFLVQQINEFPDNIKGNIDLDSAKMCRNGEECADINSNSIAINPKTGQEFPIILAVPFTGCGGNCCNYADCLNSCTNTLDFELNFNKVGNLKGAGCSGLISQYNEGKWTWDETVSKKYNNSCPVNEVQSTLAISKETNYGRHRTDVNGGRINYCTTQNMHFDINSNVAPFVPNIPSSEKFNNGTNVIVRYKRVNCNILGNSNICGVKDGMFNKNNGNPCGKL